MSHSATPLCQIGVARARGVSEVMLDAPGEMRLPPMLSRMRRMRLLRHALAVLALLACSGVGAAQPKSEVMISFGRGTDDADIDVVRLAYRRILSSDARWWVPTLVELGGGI